MLGFKVINEIGEKTKYYFSSIKLGSKRKLVIPNVGQGGVAGTLRNC